MNDKIIIAIVIIIIIFIIIILYKNSENFDASSESVQNIASVYADTKGTATFNNIKISGDITNPYFAVNKDAIGMNKNLWAQAIFAQKGLSVTGNATVTGDVAADTITTPNFSVSNNAIGMNKNLWCKGIFAGSGLYVSGLIRQNIPTLSMAPNDMNAMKAILPFDNEDGTSIQFYNSAYGNSLWTLTRKGNGYRWSYVSIGSNE